MKVRYIHNILPKSTLQNRNNYNSMPTDNYTVSQKNRTRLLCLITPPKIEQYQIYLTQVIVHPLSKLCRKKLLIWHGTICSRCHDNEADDNSM